jgi:hypothetical protein
VVTFVPTCAIPGIQSTNPINVANFVKRFYRVSTDVEGSVITALMGVHLAQKKWRSKYHIVDTILK